MNFKNLLLTLATALSLCGCSYALDSLYPTPTSSTGNSSQSTDLPSTQIDYALIKTTIMEPNCYSCHSAAGGNQGGVNLETYQNLKAHIFDVQSDVASNDMPLGGPALSSSEKNLLNAWIANGAPETVTANPPTTTPSPSPSPSPSPTPTPTPSPSPSPTPAPTPKPSPSPSPTPSGEVLSYQSVNSQVIQPYCLSCHSSAGGNRAGINLETYTNVLKNISRVKSTIAGGSMPLGAKLSAAQKKLIADWIAAGAPQTAPATKNAAPSSSDVMTKAYIDFTSGATH